MRSRNRHKGKGRPGRRGFSRGGRPGRQERSGNQARPATGGAAGRGTAAPAVANAAAVGAAGGGRADAKLVAGELRLHRDGYGFVVPASPGREDVFIPAPYVGEALHTDVVEVRVLPGRGGKKEGRIVRILERRLWKLMGRLERTPQGFQVVADDRRVRHRIVVASQDVGGARHGNNVIVRIVRHPEAGAPMQGAVIQVLGGRGEEATEKAAIITRHHLERDFPPQVVREAASSRRLMEEPSPAARTDLRSIPFVTIDGESAQDFDDAVAVERREGSAIRLWVSIADVSWFVRPGSVLDRAAFERATSVYFPSDCLPMLPEELSNDLCSLKPEVDRFTFTAELDVDARGRLVRKKFYRSVIRSRARMTYTAVRQILVDRNPEERDRFRALVPRLELMEECHRRLRAERLRRGSIDFDLPEPEIVLDLQGTISDIVRAERHVGHMMIEDFMIAANEAVAEFLTSRGGGCIYRVHDRPAPEKLQEFALLLHNLGHRFHLDRDVAPGALARVVERVRGRPEERLVNHMLLRSMAQALYSPENLGHFGLASACYCHFTSPIRRYPDLVVHRLLAAALSDARRSAEGRGEGQQKAREPRRAPAGLQEIALHCSRRERIAMEAEREMAKLCAAQFMESRVGELFEGLVSHVTKWGFFVELVDFFVEGLVHLESLPDDRYRFEEREMAITGRRHRRSFRIGDRVRVEVAEVDIPNREIHFSLASSNA